LLNLINSYLNKAGSLVIWDHLIWGMFIDSGLKSLKANWFICITASLSVIYLIKLYVADRNSVNLNRFYFWMLMALIPLIEPMSKVGFEYHFAQCLPGLVGLSAMGWRSINRNESKQVKISSLLILWLMSLIVIVPTVNRTVIKSNFIFTPSVAIERITMLDSFRDKQTIERSQYLIAAAKIYELSREDSTLAVSGFWQPVYPLTDLLPPTYKLCSLRSLFISLSYSEDKMIKVLEEYRPTLILLSPSSLMNGDADFVSMVEKTNLYNKVGHVPKNLAIDKGYLSGTIYRLKDFK